MNCWKYDWLPARMLTLVLAPKPTPVNWTEAGSMSGGTAWVTTTCTTGAVAVGSFWKFTT